MEGLLQLADFDVVRHWSEILLPLDPFGDFDLLFGAARLNLKIIEARRPPVGRVLSAWPSRRPTRSRRG